MPMPPSHWWETNTQTSTFGRNAEDFDEASMPVPKTLDRYQVTELIGRGAFGEVYLGWDPRLLRKVAIKVPRIRGKQSGEQVEDLLQEAQRAVQLEQHRGIVPVYDVGRDGEVAYIVSKYVKGGNARRVNAPRSVVG